MSLSHIKKYFFGYRYTLRLPPTTWLAVGQLHGWYCDALTCGMFTTGRGLYRTFAMATSNFIAHLLWQLVKYVCASRRGSAICSCRVLCLLTRLLVSCWVFSLWSRFSYNTDSRVSKWNGYLDYVKSALDSCHKFMLFKCQLLVTTKGYVL